MFITDIFPPAGRGGMKPRDSFTRFNRRQLPYPINTALDFQLMGGAVFYESFAGLDEIFLAPLFLYSQSGKEGELS